MPTTPSYTPRGNTLHLAAGDVLGATFDIVALSSTMLSDKSGARHVVHR